MNEIWPVVIIVLQLIFLEGILSIDNAAVIGALEDAWIRDPFLTEVAGTEVAGTDQGITALLVDMRTPGIEARPIVTMLPTDCGDTPPVNRSRKTVKTAPR